MLRIGYFTDENNAISLHRISSDAQSSIGYVLSGFGTTPPVDCICDDGLRKVLLFAGERLQKAMNEVFDRQCTDMDTVAKYISRVLQSVNQGIRYFNAMSGQGSFLCGVIYFICEADYILLPFGGGKAYLANNENIVEICGSTVEDHDYNLIHNALGGMSSWSENFTQGELPSGWRILCMTDQPDTDAVKSVLNSMHQGNPAMVASSIGSNIAQHACVPVAVQDILRIQDAVKEQSNE